MGHGLEGVSDCQWGVGPPPMPDGHVPTGHVTPGAQPTSSSVRSELGSEHVWGLGGRGLGPPGSTPGYPFVCGVYTSRVSVSPQAVLMVVTRGGYFDVGVKI